MTRTFPESLFLVYLYQWPKRNDENYVMMRGNRFPIFRLPQTIAQKLLTCLFKSKLEVKNDGSVKLNSINEQGKIDITKTEVINEIEDIDELLKTIEPNEFLNLEAKAEKENFEVELPWQNLKVVLDNGQELPEWIIYDPKTGKVTATPPENVQSIDLKVIVENPNGELSVKDIKLDFVNENAQETKNIIENETKFVSLSSQLSKEYSDWDDYGSQLIDRL